MRRSRRAFTLIEVMAATVMLGLFVAAITQMLRQAGLSEGRARLQAKAAALADRAIAELEEGIARGAAPPLGEGEKEVPGETDSPAFRVSSRVAAFDASTLVPEPVEQDSRAPRPTQQAVGATGWLAAPAAKESPPLLEIEVRVSWDGAPVDAESGEPFAIRRRSFALNPAALELLQENPGDREGVE
jgi:prepilin-type N-terminal cleavage/methylation domain-containing protein